MDQPSDRLKTFLTGTGLIGDNDVWRAQSGGRTNKVWRVTGVRDLICKLYAPERHPPMFPNLPETEFACLTSYQGKQIAPQPLGLFDTPDGPCLVYKFVEGPVWDTGVKLVANLMQRVWDMPSIDGLATLAQDPKDILAEGDAILSMMSIAPKALIKSRPAPIAINPNSPVVVHRDFVAQNMILSENGLILIDWQCPALGDPVEDVTSFLSPTMQMVYQGKLLSGSERDSLLRALPQQIADRYRHVGLFYHWRLACYAALRASQGAADYEPAWLAECALVQNF